MRILGYGIELIRLKEEHLEMVRKWRNAEFIQQRMQYRKKITSDMQMEWFLSINNTANNYFIIKTNEELIGLINGAQIDWEKKETGSGGIFIWNQTYWRSPSIAAASLLMNDVSVAMGLERTFAEILDSNTEAISFNNSMGYELIDGPNEHGANRYVLENTTYLARKTALIGKLFSSKISSEMTIILETKSNPLECFYLDRCQAAEKKGLLKLVVDE